MAENTGDYRFAPNIKARHQAQKEAMRGIHDQGEREYGVVRGDYSDRDYSSSSRNRILMSGYSSKDFAKKVPNVESLTGFEIFLQRTIDKLLLLKKKDYPVVILDIGSMAGLSWHRLASHYKDKVKEGELVFVTSSLAYEHDREKETAPKFKKDSLSVEESFFLKESNDLVQHIHATPSQLRRKQIDLPNGRRIALEHNVDLVHEHHSITAWSKVPDIDILRIPALLSETGTYFVYEADLGTMYGSARPSKEEQERRRGVKLAHEQLKSTYRLTEVTKVEEGQLKGEALNYVVFRKHNAPAIVVDDRSS